LYRENNFSFLYFDDCYFSTILTSTSLSSSTEEIVNKANLLITHSFAMIMMMMMLCTFVFSPSLLSFRISYLFLYPFTYALQ
jgi:hypothetical protein